MKMEAKPEKAVYTYDKKKQVLTLITGVLIAYAITCTSFIGCALMLTYTDMKESSVPLIVTITCIIAVVVAGFDAARGALGKGWLWGLGAGLLYALVLWCIGFWMSEGFSLDSRTLTLTVLCIAGGGLGGIIGINFKK